MKQPQVLILAENDFHRRLMTDVVSCNEMRVVSSDRFEWVDRVEKGSYQADVVVIDCGMEDAAVTDAVDRLRALPKSMRPRVIGWSRGRGFDRDDAELELEDRLEFPLDLGRFARTVKEQAHVRVLADTL